MTPDRVAQPLTEPQSPEQRRPARLRDPRIDMLRGFALLAIFVDHIPYNALSRLTPRAFGFSDAAEIFVFLAGYSACLVYPPVFVREGWWAGWSKIIRRCLVLWGVHGLLLVVSLLIVAFRACFTDRALPCLGPFLAAGFDGLLRGLTLQGLPAYLDILPLYILLLSGFPILLAALHRSVPATLVGSLAVYVVAGLQGWNLPSQIDGRVVAAVWTFSPFTWQLMFVLGAAAAYGRSQGWPWLTVPPRPLMAACVGVLVYGFVALDAWNLWPALAEAIFPRAALSDDWKVSDPPWRVLHGLALITLVLGSRHVEQVTTWPSMTLVKACGRFSLPVFSVGCILSLLGRIAFAALGTSAAVQLAVNSVGLAAQLLLAWWLLRRSASRPARPRRDLRTWIPEMSS